MNARDTTTQVPGAARLAARACHGGIVQVVHDWVAEEVPVALQYNGLSHAVMLASPIDLEDFAYGFSLSEGLIDSAADLHDVEPQRTPQGIVLQIDCPQRGAASRPEPSSARCTTCATPRPCRPPPAPPMPPRGAMPAAR